MYVLVNGIPACTLMSIQLYIAIRISKRERQCAMAMVYISHDHHPDLPCDLLRDRTRDEVPCFKAHLRCDRRVRSHESNVATALLAMLRGICSGPRVIHDSTIWLPRTPQDAVASEQRGVLAFSLVVSASPPALCSAGSHRQA